MRRRVPPLLLVLMAILLLVGLGILTGCTAGGNTPYGSFDFSTAPLVEKKSVRKTTSIPDPATKAAPVVTEETECQGGICKPPAR